MVYVGKVGIVVGANLFALDPLELKARGSEVADKEAYTVHASTLFSNCSTL
jgi:hypothetical protein